VSASELTPPVIDELLKQYPTSKLAAVYRNDKGDFKLIMVLQSGTRRTVYIDAMVIGSKRNNYDAKSEKKPQCCGFFCF
jgi:hypothetical protein